MLSPRSQPAARPVGLYAGASNLAEAATFGYPRVRSF